jgi:hypothetical protein
LAPFLINFLSPEIATYISICFPCSLSRIMMSYLLLRMVLSVWTCWSHSMVTLPSDFFLLIMVTQWNSSYPSSHRLVSTLSVHTFLLYKCWHV